MGDNFSNISHSTIISNSYSLAVENARGAAQQLAINMQVPDALRIATHAAQADETLMLLTSYMRSWQSDMEQYCADGYAHKAAEMAAWIAVGWAVYRAELLAMG